jgi:mono/diheme cytochrome c family protein
VRGEESLRAEEVAERAVQGREATARATPKAGSRWRLTATAAVVASLAFGGGALAQAPWLAPPGEKGKKNPLPADKAALDLGRKVAEANCVPCHGNNYKGDGPAAVALNPKPADWTSPRVQDQTEGELFWKVAAGRNPMPSWKHLPDKERWAVVRFIKSLKK